MSCGKENCQVKNDLITISFQVDKKIAQKLLTVATFKEKNIEIMFSDWINNFIEENYKEMISFFDKDKLTEE